MSPTGRKGEGAIESRAQSSSRVRMCLDFLSFHSIICDRSLEKWRAKAREYIRMGGFQGRVLDVQNKSMCTLTSSIELSELGLALTSMDSLSDYQVISDGKVIHATRDGTTLSAL